MENFNIDAFGDFDVESFVADVLQHDDLLDAAMLEDLASLETFGSNGPARNRSQDRFRQNAQLTPARTYVDWSVGGSSAFTETPPVVLPPPALPGGEGSVECVFEDLFLPGSVESVFEDLFLPGSVECVFEDLFLPGSVESVFEDLFRQDAQVAPPSTHVDWSVGGSSAAPKTPLVGLGPGAPPGGKGIIEPGYRRYSSNDSSSSSGSESTQSGTSLSSSTNPFLTGSDALLSRAGAFERESSETSYLASDGSPSEASMSSAESPAYGGTHTRGKGIKMSYYCYECDRKYSDLFKYVAHKDCHEDMNKTCPVCKKVYASKSGMRAHMRRMHAQSARARAVLAARAQAAPAPAKKAARTPRREVPREPEPEVSSPEPLEQLGYDSVHEPEVKDLDLIGLEYSPEESEYQEELNQLEEGEEAVEIESETNTQESESEAYSETNTNEINTHKTGYEANARETEHEVNTQEVTYEVYRQEQKYATEAQITEDGPEAPELVYDMVTYQPSLDQREVFEFNADDLQTMNLMTAPYEAVTISPNGVFELSGEDQLQAVIYISAANLPPTCIQWPTAEDASTAENATTVENTGSYVIEGYESESDVPLIYFSAPKKGIDVNQILFNKLRTPKFQKSITYTGQKEKGSGVHVEKHHLQKNARTLSVTKSYPKRPQKSIPAQTYKEPAAKEMNGDEEEIGDEVTKYECKACQRTFKNKTQYLKHTKGHGNPNVTCRVCKKVYASVSSLKTHSKLHQRKHKCKLCTMTYEKTRQLDNHMKKHEKETVDTHDVVEELNVVQEEPVHVEVEEVPQVVNFKAPYVISECITKKISDDDNTKRKIVKNQVCDLCEKRFDRVGDLKRHLIEHIVKTKLAQAPVVDGLMQLTCDICSKTFSQIDTYKADLREHAGLTLYNCCLCDKTFSNSSNFSKHKKVHGSGKYQCNTCNKTFFTLKMLKQHIKGHEETGTLQCHLCPRQFYNLSNLNKHIKIGHGNDCHFLCRFCDLKFGTAKAKFDHQWTVHGIRKTSTDCSYCGEKFRKASELRRHRKAYHAR